ncbi:MAG: TldD/PmbA family protein [Spirochaetales bacterium]|nr:TldD/PmbA family protein [Spirochaetales bacterium]
MVDKDKARYGLNSLKKRGADKAHVILSESARHELNVESGDFSLLRTTYNNNISFRVIKENKQGTFSANKLDNDSIDRAAETVFTMAQASEEDPAYAIAEKQPPDVFTRGREKPDLDLMYKRLKIFLDTIHQQYPKTIIRQASIDFTAYNYSFLNTNGVDFTTTIGYYTFGTIFTSREGKKASSFNYSHFCSTELDHELIEYGSIRTLLDQSSGQIELKNLDRKFDGEIIITPDCLNSFIDSFTYSFLSDYSIISGTSIFKDSLNMQVADSRLTLHAAPLSKEITTNYFVTRDGYRAENCTIIDKGVLRTFLLSLYGANKTGKKRALNNGNCYIIEPGDMAQEDIIRSVKQGLLVCRVSGGRPNDKGDFSVVAKNSYYIENGKVMFPVHETMITGNIADLFMNFKAISKERINFGTGIYPWVLAGGVTISGK